MTFELVSDYFDIRSWNLFDFLYYCSSSKLIYTFISLYNAGLWMSPPYCVAWDCCHIFHLTRNQFWINWISNNLISQSQDPINRHMLSSSELSIMTFSYIASYGVSSMSETFGFFWNWLFCYYLICNQIILWRTILHPKSLSLLIS